MGHASALRLEDAGRFKENRFKKTAALRRAVEGRGNED